MKAIHLLLISYLIISHFASAASIFSGEDLNTSNAPGQIPDNPIRLSAWPHSSAAATRFLGRVHGVVTESFEGFPASTSPTVISLGSVTATLSGAREVRQQLTGTYNGAYPTAGDKFLMLNSDAPGYVKFSFSSPQSAFGIFITDIEEAQLQVTQITADGTRISYTPNSTVNQGSGGVAFFGLIDAENPFVALELSRVGNAGDGFGFDQLMIGQVGSAVTAQEPTWSLDRYAGISIYGTIGATYRVQYTTDLVLGSWTTLADVTIDRSPLLYTDPTPMNQLTVRFYRAIVSP